MAEEGKTKIYRMISAVMEDVGFVGKNGVNTFDKYRFRGIDDVMNALHPAMVKNKVFVAPEVLECAREERQSKNGGNMIYTTMKVRYTFYTDDGSSVSATVIGEAADRSDKSSNKAMSAAFKYACFQTFCIPTEEMKDADEESPEIGAREEPRQGRGDAEADAKRRAEELKAKNGLIASIEALCKQKGKTINMTVVKSLSVERLKQTAEQLRNVPDPPADGGGQAA